MEEFGNDSEDSVELSLENVSAVLKSFNNSHAFEDPTKSYSKAQLTIIEQPQSRGFRFRYKCEGPSHGGLQGVNSEKGKKTYPTVQIMNYEGSARILVSLVTDDHIPKTHAHELVGKNCSKGICLIDVKEAKDPICQFQNVGVMHVTKRKVSDVLKERILESMLLNKRIWSGNVNNENIQLDRAEIEKAKAQAEAQAKSMQLNVVRLCFQAYLHDKNGNPTIMLPSVVSNPIYDSKSPGAAALKICRMDKCGGCCTGNEEVFLLCEKVQKEDIRVYFIEMDRDQRVVWKKEANFGPTDVHKQYAIVFKTPAYRNTSIKDSVKVYIQLERPSDKECSEPKLFTYYPQNLDEDDIERKRRKVLPTTLDNSFPNFTDNLPLDSTDLFGLMGPFLQFTNGGSGMNRSPQNFSCEAVDDSGFDGGILSKFSDSKVSLEMTDGNDLEVDCQPCNTATLKPYQPLIFHDDKNNSIIGEKESYSAQIKKETDIKIPETEDREEICKDIKKLHIGTKTKLSDMPLPKEKSDPIKQKYPHLDMLLLLRNFCATGNIMDLLKKNRSLLMIQDKYGDNCLHLALINKQPHVVKSMLPVFTACPEDLNISNYRFQTSLHLAVLTNQPEMVALLLKQGIERTLVDCYGNTAVHLAVKYNYIACLKTLLNPKFGKPSTTDPFPELDMLNSEGFSPLHLACLKGSTDSVRLLTDSKAEVNLPDGKSGRSPLHIAVENNDLLLASELLLESECDTTCVTFDGNTPLHLACGRSYAAMVNLLLSVGANPEATSGMTDWCPSDDDDMEINEGKGIKPRDLVCNNDQILNLLNGEPYTSGLESSHSDITDIFPGNLGQLSYQTQLTLANLIDSADGKQNWKSLARTLQIEYLINEADKSTESPSLYILETYDTIGGNIIDLYEAFLKLGMADAACLLKDQILK